MTQAAYVPDAMLAAPAAPAERWWRRVSVPRVEPRAVGRLGVRAASVAACLLVWHVASQNQVRFIINFTNIPSPADVAEAGWTLLTSDRVVNDTLASLLRIFLGFGLASALGVGLGVVIGRFRWAEDSLLSPLEVIRPIPAVAWIPMAILMFASAEGSMIFITFIGAFFPILLNTIHGVRQVDPRLVLASRCLGAGGFSIYKEVVLPAALPYVVTGLSIGMGTSWFSLVSAEMISGQYGIGYYTWESYNLQDYPSLVVGMIAIGILGMGSSALVRAGGVLCMPWQRVAAKQR